MNDLMNSLRGSVSLVFFVILPPPLTRNPQKPPHARTTPLPLLAQASSPHTLARARFPAPPPHGSLSTSPASSGSPPPLSESPPPLSESPPSPPRIATFAVGIAANVSSPRIAVVRIAAVAWPWRWRSTAPGSAGRRPSWTTPSRCCRRSGAGAHRPPPRPRSPTSASTWSSTPSRRSSPSSPAPIRSFCGAISKRREMSWMLPSEASGIIWHRIQQRPMLVPPHLED
ncbi:hypothetical protein VPH35_035866 [Triticum aestivum]